MTSTGNDIVALKATNQQRSIHPRFYSKILSLSEQELFYRQVIKELSFEKFVWLLWSVKESVYKFMKRSEPTLLFSPVKIIIRGIDSPFRGGVTRFKYRQWENKNNQAGEDLYKCEIVFGPAIFYSRSKVHDEVIATEVSQNKNFDYSYWGIKSIDSPSYEAQSEAVRAFVLNRLNSILAHDYTDLSIGKNLQGYPVLLSGARELNIPVSLAHHDRFIAYSFILSPNIHTH